MLSFSSLHCLEHEDPPPLPASLACGDLPVEAFLVDAAWNFLGVEREARQAGPSFEDDLLEEMGLGKIAPQLTALDAAIRAERVDLLRWPSLRGLSPHRAERTIVAAALTLDPDLELRCELLRHLPEGPSRRARAVALLVNESHGRPVPERAIIEAPFKEESLAFEIACASQEALGLGPCDREDEDEDEHEGDDAHLDAEDQEGDDPVTDSDDAHETDGADEDMDPRIDSPVMQLYAAVRGAHRARWRGSPPSQVSGAGAERPWAYRAFGRAQARLDLLMLILAGGAEGQGLLGPEGGTIAFGGTLTGGKLFFPPGTLSEETAVAAYRRTPVVALPAGTTVAGPFVEVLMTGTLARPVTVQLPTWPRLARFFHHAPEAIGLVRVEQPGAPGASTLLEVQGESEGVVTGTTDRFSLFVALMRPDKTVIREQIAELPEGVLDVAVVGGLLLWTTRRGAAWQRLRRGEGQVMEPPPEGKAVSVAARGGAIIVATNDVQGEGRIYRWRWVSLEQGAVWELISGDVRLDRISELAIAGDGRIFFAEYQKVPLLPPGIPPGSPTKKITAFRIRELRDIDPPGSGRIRTLAGTYALGFDPAVDVRPVAAQDVPLSFHAGLGSGAAMAMDGELLFIVDAGNARVLGLNVSDKVAWLGGVDFPPETIRTVVGGGAASGFACPLYPVASPAPVGWGVREARLRCPVDVVVADESLVISEQNGPALLVAPLQREGDGHVGGDPEIPGEPGPYLPLIALAGNGQRGVSGASGPALREPLNTPGRLAWDARNRRVLYTDTSMFGGGVGSPGRLNAVRLTVREEHRYTIMTYNIFDKWKSSKFNHCPNSPVRKWRERIDALMKCLSSRDEECYAAPGVPGGTAYPWRLPIVPDIIALQELNQGVRSQIIPSAYLSPPDREISYLIDALETTFGVRYELLHAFVNGSSTPGLEIHDGGNGVVYRADRLRPMTLLGSGVPWDQMLPDATGFPRGMGYFEVVPGLDAWAVSPLAWGIQYPPTSREGTDEPIVSTTKMVLSRFELTERPGFFINLYNLHGNDNAVALESQVRFIRHTEAGLPGSAPLGPRIVKSTTYLPLWVGDFNFGYQSRFVNRQEIPVGAYACLVLGFCTPDEQRYSELGFVDLDPGSNRWEAGGRSIDHLLQVASRSLPFHRSYSARLDRGQIAGCVASDHDVYWVGIGVY